MQTYLMVATILLCLPATGATWFVDADAAAGDAGGEVWVAAGTYAGERDNVAEMAAGVDLLGGFAGI